MRKLLLTIIVAVTAIFGCIFAASCEEGIYYNVEITGATHAVCEPLKSKYKAGTEVEVKLHVVIDVDMFVYVNGQRINKSHYDSDYWGYKFTMPEEDIVVLVTTDAWYGIEICDFEDAFFWLKIYENQEVVKIRCETGYIGVSPDQQPEIVYTTDKTDIENVLNIFNYKLKPNTYTPQDGGYYIKYTFYLENEQAFVLPITNGYAELISFATVDFFEIVDFTPPTILHPESN